jgi:hypothetical protein
LDLAGGHAETDGELASRRRVRLVRSLELLLKDLGLSAGCALSVLDLVRAVVVEGRGRGFPGRLLGIEWEVGGWVGAGTDDWLLEAGIEEGPHGRLLDRGEGREWTGVEGGDRGWLIGSRSMVFRLVRSSVESQRAVYKRAAVIHFARNKRTDNEKEASKATADAELERVQEKRRRGRDAGADDRASELADKARGVSIRI